MVADNVTLEKAGWLGALSMCKRCVSSSLASWLGHTVHHVTQEGQSHQAEAAAASAESTTNVIRSVFTNRLISAGKKKQNKETPSYAHEAETHPRIVLIRFPRLSKMAVI